MVSLLLGLSRAPKGLESRRYVNGSDAQYFVNIGIGVGVGVGASTRASPSAVSIALVVVGSRWLGDGGDDSVERSVDD